MSSSYGPGRYDPEYEEQGLDYPYAYVRWTENRNMQAFAELLRTGKVRLNKLITHVFPFREAKDAYQLILDRSQPFAGIVLKYDTGRSVERTVVLHRKPIAAADPAIGLIGAGGFGQNFLLPAMKGHGSFVTIVTSRPQNARNIADKYGFASCSGDANDIFTDERINTVFIATRHDSHAAYVLKALESGKNVFVEKPLCLHPEELADIKKAYEKSGVRLMVGFNRRFAPLLLDLKNALPSEIPLAIHYRINAGVIPQGHWVHDVKTGGGRIVGEVCHFIDLCGYLAGSRISSLSAVLMRDASDLQDTVAINLKYENGSIAQVSYFSNGNKNVPKEKIEVYGGGLMGILDDFKTLTIHGKEQVRKSANQDKGHQQEVEQFLNSIRNNTTSPIPFEDLYLSTLATFKVLESAATNGAMIRM